jgi:integral membrane sensor domain MASE1
LRLVISLDYLYNLNETIVRGAMNSMTTAGVIRTILVVDIVAMALLAIFYLRQRRMSWAAYCWWSIVALVVPILGPFLVISNRPGEWHPDRDLRVEAMRMVNFLSRLLPSQPGERLSISTPAERARRRRQTAQRKTPR